MIGVLIRYDFGKVLSASSPVTSIIFNLLCPLKFNFDYHYEMQEHQMDNKYLEMKIDYAQ
jgi:hypothetical protein